MESIRLFSETLQPSLAPVVKEIGEKHITLFKTLHRKNLSLNNLKDESDVIPKSVNVMRSFKLRASKETEELVEFTELQEETSQVIAAFRAKMKEQVLKSIALEIKTLREAVHSHYITAIRQLAEAEFLSTTSTTKIDYHSKVSVLFESEHNFFKNIDLGYEIFLSEI